MRLVSFRPAGEGALRTGLVAGDEVVDLTDPAVGLPGDMVALLAGGDEALERAARAPAGAARRFPYDRVELAAPVPRPGKLLAVALNYASHAAEVGRAAPAYPDFFTKAVTAVTGPFDAIEVPRASAQVDYEGELALVIGRRCRHVPAERAAEVVAGYTVLDDVSVRDWQWRGTNFTVGKSFDTHAPMGPALVTADELGDPHRLSLRTWVSGDLRQDATTDDLIFSCFEQVAYLSEAMTLEPGDVVSTGTPAGVGVASDPPRWLVAGDVVRVEIEGIGSLENPVVDEPPPGGVSVRPRPSAGGR